MKSIGGYFELELARNNSEFHYEKVIRLNTARNAFEYILLANEYKKVFIPYFSCDVMLEPLKRHAINYEYYNIDEQLEPVFDFGKLGDSTAFLYTNYFGLKDSFVTLLKKKCKNLIIDNAQSFYSKPEDNVATIYSARKFFGVSDGAYLYSNILLPDELTRDYSASRFGHLLLRIDKSAEEGYTSFVENDKSLENQSIKIMSQLTHNILKSINYEEVKRIRIQNYEYLAYHLSFANKLNIKRPTEQTPMVFPFWSDGKDQRKRLISNRIYTASYWPNVLSLVTSESLEYRLTNEVLHLPIDQRYNFNDLDRIVRLLLK